MEFNSKYEYGVEVWVLMLSPQGWKSIVGNVISIVITHDAGGTHENYIISSLPSILTELSSIYETEELVNEELNKRNK